MHEMKLAKYLGVHVSRLLASEPFSGWPLRRSLEDDLPEKEVWYEFEDHGVQVICDEDESIRTIFLHAGVDESLSEISFALRRKEVLARFGAPSKSGAATRHPVLSESGAWDRFILGTMTIHVQYRVDSDEIDMITLMRPDAVP
jgi:hypothetical protein